MDKNNSRDKAETANVRLIESFYESLGRGDVPAVLGLLAPDVKWTEAERFPYYTGTWTGPQAVLDNLLKRLIVDWDRFSAKAKTGKAMEASFAHLWAVRDGKIASFLMFTDTAKILEALAFIVEGDRVISFGVYAATYTFATAAASVRATRTWKPGFRKTSPCSPSLGLGQMD